VSLVKEAVAANEAGLTASPGGVNNDPTAHAQTRDPRRQSPRERTAGVQNRECPERSPLGDWRCHCERTHISRSHPVNSAPAMRTDLRQPVACFIWADCTGF